MLCSSLYLTFIICDLLFLLTPLCAVPAPLAVIKITVADPLSWLITLLYEDAWITSNYYAFREHISGIPDIVHADGYGEQS